MVLQVKLPFLDSLEDMSYPTKKKIPVFLNGDLLNPIGDCQMISNDELSGILWLTTEVSKDLFMYYLKDTHVTDCFHFAGLHLCEKPLRKERWRKRHVIQLPVFEIGKEKRTKRLKDVAIWGLPKD